MIPSHSIPNPSRCWRGRWSSAALIPVVLFAVLALPAAAQAPHLFPAPAGAYHFDPMHTAVHFSVRHMGISTVHGRFTKVQGQVTYDPQDPSRSSVQATIETASVSTGVQFRDNDLRSPHFLDVAKYPTMTFTSTKVESAGPGRLKVTGNLTLHGVTKPVVLNVEGPTQALRDPRGNIHMGATATTTLNRDDFGVSSLPGIVGTTLNIEIDMELVQPSPAATATRPHTAH